MSLTSVTLVRAEWPFIGWISTDAVPYFGVDLVRVDVWTCYYACIEESASRRPENHPQRVISWGWCRCARRVSKVSKKRHFPRCRHNSRFKRRLLPNRSHQIDFIRLTLYNRSLSWQQITALLIWHQIGTKFQHCQIYIKSAPNFGTANFIPNRYQILAPPNPHSFGTKTWHCTKIWHCQIGTKSVPRNGTAKSPPNRYQILALPNRHQIGAKLRQTQNGNLYPTNWRIRKLVSVLKIFCIIRHGAIQLSSRSGWNVGEARVRILEEWSRCVLPIWEGMLCHDDMWKG